MPVGKLFFALVDPDEVFDEVVHAREDVPVFSLNIDQSEGQFASASIEIPNMGIGILSPAFKKRIFISCEHEGGIKLLFSGRVMGFPSNLSGETITLEYDARPEGWETTQYDFIQTLKVAPYYNQLFIDPDKWDDATEILETRSALIHWNRASGGISLSDIIEGSEFIDVDDNFLFDSLSSTIGDAPLNFVDVQIEAQWEQIGIGEVNAGEAIRLEFTNSAIATPQINTLSPLSFEDAWNGAKTPSGYDILESVLTPVADEFDLQPEDLRSGWATVSGEDYPTKKDTTPSVRAVSVPRVWYQGKLTLQASYEQKRREVLVMRLAVATQDFSLKGDAGELISLRLQDVTSEIQGEILSPKKPSFFYDPVEDDLTSYGQGVIENGLLRARARLVKSSRIIETQFQTDVSDVVDVSCDHSIRISDQRLPGENVRGKVLGYSFSFTHEEQIAQLSIGSVIGTGVDSTGTGLSLAETIYDQESGPMTSEIFYQLDDAEVLIPIDVEQMESDDSYLIDDVTVLNSGESQVAGWMTETKPDEYIQANKTSVVVDLKSMNPAKELYAEVNMVTFLMTLPKQIDLGAT